MGLLDNLFGGASRGGRRYGRGRQGMGRRNIGRARQGYGYGRGRAQGGGFFSSPIGRIALGSLAAYAARRFMNRRRTMA